MKEKFGTWGILIQFRLFNNYYCQEALGTTWKIFLQVTSSRTSTKIPYFLLTVIPLSWWCNSVQIEFLFSQHHTSVLWKNFTHWRKKKKLESFKICQHNVKGFTGGLVPLAPPHNYTGVTAFLFSSLEQEWVMYLPHCWVWNGADGWRNEYA